MKKDFLRKNYLHIISIGILMLFIALGVFYFPNAICRLLESVRDLGLSIAYKFTEAFEMKGLISPTVNDLPSWQLAPSKFQPLTLLPQNLDLFVAKIKLYGEKLIDEINLIEYILLLLRIFITLVEWLMPISFLLLILYLKYENIFRVQNNKYNVDSQGVKTLRYIYKFGILPVFRFLKKLYLFIKEHFYYKTYVIIWAFYFNFFTIAIEFFAYYFYFLEAFDFFNLYRQVYKLLLDLTPMLKFMPEIFWMQFFNFFSYFFHFVWIWFFCTIQTFI